MSPSLRSSLWAAVALAGALGLSGCEGEHLSVSAADCWGLASGSDAGTCKQVQAPVLAALGLDGALLNVVTASCGEAVNCKKVLATAPQRKVVRRPKVKRPKQPVATPATAAPTPAEAVAVAEPTPDEATPAVADAETPTPAAETTPTPEDGSKDDGSWSSTSSGDEGKDPVASSSGGLLDNCAGITIPGIEGKGKLSANEQTCLKDTAMGKRQASDTDVQTAAIALYNARVSGWEKAVEKALKKPSLGNAPQLNFAGIKAAYSNGSYGMTLKRARTVWRNLDKGYQLSGSDKTFVVEFGCRASGQLALNGKPPSDGLDWCERWLDRAERAGQDTSAIEDLISQVE